MNMRKLLFPLIFAAALPAGAQQNGDAKMNAFVSGLMGKMTLDEKIGQLNLVTPGGAVTGSVVSSDVDGKIRRGAVGGLFGIYGPEKTKQAQKIAVENTRLKIPLIFGLDVIHGHRTIFPIPLGLSCSWDTALIRRSAQIAALEATADGLQWAFSPMVDIARDPRWGRIAEGSGEDHVLGSAISRAMVLGYQGSSLSDPKTVMACVKHFALYGAAEAGRDYNTVDMSRRVMYQYFMPPYKAAIDAGVGSVMSSFNVVDGIPATGNRWLLTELLRQQWGFKGMVVSDYTSVNEMIDHGMGDLQTVSAMSLRAGLDMDMVGEGFLTTLKKSLQEGKVTQAQIDAACRRILEAKYKLGLFEDPYRYMDESRPAKEILSDAHRTAAREAAAKSFVLLKSSNGVLPLKKAGSIALVGPLADSRRNMLGTWAVSGDFEKAVTVIEGMRNVGGSGVTINYARGANVTDDTALAKRLNAFSEQVTIDPRGAQALIDEAVAAAQKSDVIVAVVGESAEATGESSSRADIALPQNQLRLLQALKATGKPLVVVLFNGRPMTLNWEAENVDAMLDVWFGGTEGGNAIADVLFGAYNPSGKLTTTFPRSVGQIPIYYNHLSTGRPYNGGAPKFRSNYLDVSNDPLFPFGFGLSYTTFSYGEVQLAKKTVRPGESVQASITVTNTGNWDGEETVQLYLQDIYATIAQPVKQLKHFQKVQLKKGESKTVTFTIGYNDLKFYTNDLKQIAEPGDFNVFIGGNSRDVKAAKFTLLAK